MNEDEEEIIQYDCDLCKDTGYVEVMGGSEADEWDVVGTKRCVCQDW